jgi:hypothetical protein
VVCEYLIKSENPWLQRFRQARPFDDGARMRVMRTSLFLLEELAFITYEINPYYQGAVADREIRCMSFEDFMHLADVEKIIELFRRDACIGKVEVVGMVYQKEQVLKDIYVRWAKSKGFELPLFLIDDPAFVQSGINTTKMALKEMDAKSLRNVCIRVGAEAYLRNCKENPTHATIFRSKLMKEILALFPQARGEELEEKTVIDLFKDLNDKRPPGSVPGPTKRKK